jgi:O-antigen/teichoic acid export membrane protein
MATDQPLVPSEIRKGSKSPSLRHAVHRFSWLSAAEAVRVAISTFVVVYVARRLGANVFGYYSFALSVIGALTSLVDGGFTSVGSREIARHPAQLRSTVRAVVRLRLLLAAMALAVLLVFVAGIDKPLVEKQVVLLAGCSLFTFALTLDWVFYGLGRSQLVAAAAITRVAVFAGLTLSIVRGTSQVWLLPLFQATGELLAAAQLGHAYRRAANSEGPEPRRPDAPLALLAAQAWPLGIGQLMRAVNFWFSVILIGLLVGDGAAGRFAAAQRLAQFAMGFAPLYFVGYLPLISKGLVQSPEVLRRLTADSLRMTTLITVPIAAGGALLAEPIVRLVFGPDYAPSAAPLAVLMWAVPALIIGGHFRNALIAASLVRLDLVWVSGSAVTNVLLSVALLPSLGLVGAAIASTMAECVLALGAFSSVRRHGIEVSLLAALGRPAAASGIMAVAVLACRPAGLMPAVAAGIITYGIALVILGEPWPGAARSR